ncbi:MAG: redox-sensing transcriptional repressor Rex [Bacteroidota bacterium]
MNTINRPEILPERTVERLSQYRRVLLKCLADNKSHIFSHDLAKLLHITSVQVRRDIMLIGYQGSQRKGYDIKELTDLIGNIIDSESPLKVCVVGMGHLGRAITTYFKGKRHKLDIIASFDTSPEKTDHIIAGVFCHPYEKHSSVIADMKITIAILAVPAKFAADVAKDLVSAGIKSIVNYSSTALNVPDGVYLEEYDMITSLEKAAYFVKKNSQKA